MPACPPAAAGVYDSVQGVALYKSSANSSAIIFSPSSVLYVQDAPPPSSAALSAGAVAGICAGAAVLAAGLLALLVMKHRRRQRSNRELSDLALSKLEAAPAPATTDSFPSNAGSSLDPGQCAAEVPPPSLQCSVRVSPPRVSPQPSVAAVCSYRPVVHPGISPHDAAATSPFSALAMNAFCQPAASGSPGPASSALGGVEASAPAEAPLPELLRIVGEYDREQELSVGSLLDVGAHLAALPSSLPPELRDWVIPPSAITLLRWPNGNLRELGSGARCAAPCCLCGLPAGLQPLPCPAGHARLTACGALLPVTPCG